LAEALDALVASVAGSPPSPPAIEDLGAPLLPAATAPLVVGEGAAPVAAPAEATSTVVGSLLRYASGEESTEDPEAAPPPSAAPPDGEGGRGGSGEAAPSGEGAVGLEDVGLEGLLSWPPGGAKAAVSRHGAVRLEEREPAATPPAHCVVGGLF
jgi:hypothetical protein